MTDRPRILFLTLTNDVGSDRIVSDIGQEGAVCAVLGPRNSFASLVRCVSARFEGTGALGIFASTFTLRRRLAAAVSSWRPDRIVPLDEFSGLLLRTMGADARAPSTLRKLIIASLGEARGYEAACHRLPLMKAAARAGVRTPAFCGAVGSGSAEAVALSLGFPMMVKRDHSSGSAGVVRVEDRLSLVRALRTAHARTVLKRWMARVAGFGRGLAPALLQEYIRGQLAMHTVACQDGEVVEGASFVAVEVHPDKKASTVLRAIVHPEMAEAAQRLVAALGCSGFVSFDFILDDANRAYLIEMNARPIGSAHLGRLFGHDLAFAFLTGTRLLQGASLHAATDLIALFPKELERDPASSYLAPGRDVVHDVPQSEPGVLAAYLAHLETVHPTRMAEIGAHVRQPAVRRASPSWPVLGQAESV